MLSFSQVPHSHMRGASACCNSGSHLTSGPKCFQIAAVVLRAVHDQICCLHMPADRPNQFIFSKQQESKAPDGPLQRLQVTIDHMHRGPTHFHSHLTNGLHPLSTQTQQAHLILLPRSLFFRYPPCLPTSLTIRPREGCLRLIATRHG